jgi:integrase
VTIGSSIFKRKRNGKLAKRWTVQLRMPDGTLVQRVGFTDKGATRQLEARMVREAERKEVGLHDQFGKAKRTPLHDHIDAFLLAMQSGTLARRRHGKPTDRWIERVRRRLAYLFRLLGASRLEHLSQGEAETVLVERVRAGWSDKTRDDHAALLRQFGSWLVDDQRAAVNPFHRLRPTRNEASKTFRRHALTVAELEQLVAAAEVRGPQQYAKVNPWDDVRLGSEPAIDVRAGTTKSKRRARLELPAWLGALLQQMRARRAAILGGPPPAHERLFAATSYRHITDQLRADAIFARLGRLDPESGRVLTDGGKTIDLHALRGTLATLAAEVGMPVKLLQQHMRHSDIRITMEVYAQVRSGAMREQVELLPAPVQRKAAKEGQA